MCDSWKCNESLEGFPTILFTSSGQNFFRSPTEIQIVPKSGSSSMSPFTAFILKCSLMWRHKEHFITMWNKNKNLLSVSTSFTPSTTNTEFPARFCSEKMKTWTPSATVMIKSGFCGPHCLQAGAHDDWGASILSGRGGGRNYNPPISCKCIPVIHLCIKKCKTKGFLF